LRSPDIGELLLREGSEGPYDAVRRYAGRGSEARRKYPGTSLAAFKTLLFKLSEAYQFDWSQEGLVRLKLPSGQGAGKMEKRRGPPIRSAVSTRRPR
jgi:hypothetical protein